MKLYMTPDACSLADHIALIEAGQSFERVEVDIPTRTTKQGEDFVRINPKGYVPAIVLDDGTLLTENVAILAWISDQCEHLRPEGWLGRFRLIEMLAFIEAEIHKPFIRHLFAPSNEARAFEHRVIEERLRQVAGMIDGEFLLGAKFTTADAFLFTILRWALAIGAEVPAVLLDLYRRIGAREAVRRALAEEGLDARAA
jgi:glutathione S-transferase